MAATWRQIYNQWERTFAPTLEQFTQSDAFRDLTAVGMQMQRTVLDETEKLSRQWLHMWNLPAAGDVRNLRRQIAGLDREVQMLRRSLEKAIEPTAVEIAPGLAIVDDPDASAVEDTEAVAQPAADVTADAVAEAR